MGSEYSPPEEVTLTTTPPSNAKPTKKGVAKNQLRKLLITEGAMRRRDDLALGNIYHTALYDLLQSPPPHEDKITTINLIKAKIVRLYAARCGMVT
jgi:hypothetical protein